MFFGSMRSLVRRYGDVKLYLTEIHLSRDSDPDRLFIFLTEYSTEMEATISAILKRKKLNRGDVTFYYVTLTSGSNCLLFIDHRRGNHYMYCSSNTYLKLTEQLHKHRHSAAIYTAAALAPAAETIQRKIIIVDSQVAAIHPSLLQLLLEAGNELILSPYYLMEIDAFIHSSSERAQTSNILESLANRYPNQFIHDMYTDDEDPRMADVSNSSDYMLSLAGQIHVTSSQIIILTLDESLARKAAIHGYRVFKPDPASHSISSLTETKPYRPAESSTASHASEGLPPRSQRKNRSVSPTRQFYRQIRTIFYQILF
jgi:hypothetical protein